MREFYPDVDKDVDANLPQLLYKELPLLGFVDSNFAHDTVTQQSITGIFLYAGWTQISCSNQHQGAIHLVRNLRPSEWLQKTLSTHDTR